MTKETMTRMEILTALGQGKRIQALNRNCWIALTEVETLDLLLNSKTQTLAARIKPAASHILVNGIKVLAPLREAPEAQEVVFLASPSCIEHASRRFAWSGR